MPASRVKTTDLRDGGAGLSTNSHNWVAGLSILSIRLLDRLSKTSFRRDPYCIYIHMYFHLPPLAGLISHSGEQGEASAAVGGSALFFVCVDTCVLLCAFVLIVCMCTYVHTGHSDSFPDAHGNMVLQQP